MGVELGQKKELVEEGRLLLRLLHDELAAEIVGLAEREAEDVISLLVSLLI